MVPVGSREARPGGLCRSRLRWLTVQLLINDALALLLIAIATCAVGVILVALLFWSGWVLMVLLLPWAGLAWRWFKGVGLRSVAKGVEKHFPEVRGRLVAALELSQYQAGGREGYSLELVKAAVRETETVLVSLPLKRLVRRRRLIWAGVGTLAGLLLLVGLWLALPSRMRPGLVNAFNPSGLEIEFRVAPGDTAVLPGGQVTLRCQVRPADISRSVRLVLRDNSGRRIHFRRLNLKPTDRNAECGMRMADGGWQEAWALAEVTVPAGEGFSYRFRLLSRASEEFRVSVLEPLVLKRLSFTYRYPDYSGLAEFRSTSTEITALKGTVIEFEGAVQRPVSAGRFIIGSETTGLAIDPRDSAHFSGSFQVLTEGMGRLELVEKESPQPVATVRVRAVQDEAPFVKLFLPGRDVDLPMSMRILLGINSLDDYGLTGLWLHYGKESLDHRLLVKRLGGRREDTTLFTWDLSQSGLLPGEVLHYCVTVTDNDPFSGPKTGRSEIYAVRFPTMAEIYDAAVHQTERTASELGPLGARQEEISRELTRVTEELKRTRELSWEERKALEQVMEKQEELMEQLEGLKQQIARAEQELLDNLTLDRETLERLGQLQELVRQLLPKELQEALAELRQKLTESSPQLAEALSRLSLEQERLRAGIERALELLKRVMEEQRLEALARKAQELAEAQKKLTEMIPKAPAEELARRQADINAGLDSLERAVAELAQELSEPEIAESLAGIADSLRRSEALEIAEGLKSQLQQGSKANAREQSGRLAQGLSRLGEGLKSLSERLKKKRSGEIALRLAALTDDILMVSNEEENLETELRGGAESGTFAPRQMGLYEATRLAAESLAGLAAQTMVVPPELGQLLAQVMESMAQAAQRMVDNQAYASRNEMANARQGLNSAARTLLNILAQMQKGGGLSGGWESLMEQLSRMTAEQMAINAGMSGIPIPIPVSGLSQAQLEQLARLLGEQQALRQALERMLQELGGERPGLTSSLEALVEEMKAVERDLAELNVDRRLIERQENILSHLLDAQRSLRQQGFKEERESEVGKPFEIRARPELPMDRGERNRLLREELIRALKQGYPQEYEQMIRDYFERLLNRP
ncbi:MAG: hypothetical protein ABIK44_00415 [candidate division WOR-3 bacterium]